MAHSLQQFEIILKTWSGARELTTNTSLLKYVLQENHS